MKFQLLTLTLSLLAVPGLGRFTDTSSDLQLIRRVIAPFRFEDLSMFSDRPENYATSDDPNDITFYLYNDAQNPEKSYPFGWNTPYSTLLSFPWIPDAPVKVLIHGFTQSQNSSMPAMVKDAYLEVMRRSVDDPSVKVNVICVDWGRLAGSTKSTYLPLYGRAVHNVQTAGVRVGQVISQLIKLGITTFEKVHIVGFSLGAHVAGYAGLTVQNLNEGRKIARITGLDPAGPLFTTNLISLSDRPRDLNSGDAQLVDVIHTSWGSYGIPKTLGHADFFPNFIQVGLNVLQTQPYCLSMLGNNRPLQVCSHNMAPVYYAMSILKPLKACKCRDYVDYKLLCRRTCSIPATFGEYYEHRTPGDYFLSIPDNVLLEPSPEVSSSSSSSESREEDPSANEVRRYPHRPETFERGSKSQSQRLSPCHNVSEATLRTIRATAEAHGLTYSLPLRLRTSPPKPAEESLSCPSSSSSLIVLYNSMDESYRLQHFSCQQGHLTPNLQPPTQLRKRSVALFGVQSDDHKSALNCTVEYATKDKSSAFKVYTSNSLGRSRAGPEFRRNARLNTVVGAGRYNAVHFMIY